MKIFNKLISEGYNLDYLNIDYNISEAEKKIADVFDTRQNPVKIKRAK